MSDVLAFMGEIRMMSFNFPPRGWAMCNGQLLPINQNQALFSLLGTQYGGNGQTNFGLPDLRGRVPVHVGGGFSNNGQTAGEQAHTVTIQEMTSHIHLAQGSNSSGDTVVPTAGVFGAAAGVYGPPTHLTSLTPTTVTTVGGSQAHENRQPFLTISFCIALTGIFPSRN